METLRVDDFLALLNLLKDLLADVLCVKCMALDKDVYVLKCCNAKCCKVCAIGREGDVCAQCATPRQPNDFHKDLISSSVADLWIKFSEEPEELNHRNYYGKCKVFISKIQALHEADTLKNSSELIRKMPILTAGSEFVVSALTKAFSSAPKGGPGPVLKALIDMENAGTASSLKTWTDEECEQVSKPLRSAVLEVLMRDFLCVRCLALEKDIYVAECCNAKFCKQCATEGTGENCGKCATKRKPMDFRKDLISSSVAEVLHKYRGDCFEGRVNSGNFFDQVGMLFSKILCLNEDLVFKIVSKFIIHKKASTTAGSEFAASSLTKVIPSAPESALKPLTHMETAGAASSLKILTEKEPEVGTKAIDSAVESCRKNEKHEKEEGRILASCGADAESVGMFGSSDKNLNGNDSDKDDSIKTAQGCAPSESYSNEDYSKEDEECFPSKPDSDKDQGSPLKITEFVSDEKLFESSPSSAAIHGPTPLNIADAMPSSVARAFHVKRLESLESGDKTPVNEKASSFIDRMTDLGIDCLEDPPVDSGMQVDELENAEVQYEVNSTNESDETVERKESENELVPAETTCCCFV